MNLTGWVENYLESRRGRGSSKYTLKDYSYYLKEFTQFAAKLPLNPETIRKYRLHLSRKNFKKSTQNYFLIALRDFIKYLNSVGQTHLDYSEITLYKHPKVKREALNPAQVDLLLWAAGSPSLQGYRDKLILQLLLQGLKPSKLSLLNRNDAKKLNLSEKTQSFLNIYLMSRKDSLNPLLIRYKGRFNVQENGEKMRLSPRSIERVVKIYAKRANLSPSINTQTLLETATFLK